MAKQTSVQAAYQKPGEKGGDGWGRCASIGLFIILALFLMTLSSDTKAEEDAASADSARTGQAHLPTAATEKVPNHSFGDMPHHEAGWDRNADDDDSIESGIPPANPYSPMQQPMQQQQPAGGYSSGGLRGSAYGEETEQDLSDMVDLAADDLKKAEANEVEKEEGMLHSTLSAMGSGLRATLKLLGWGSDEAEEIAVEVEEELEKEVKDELEEDADEVAEDAISMMQVNVENEEMEGEDFDEIEEEVLNHENEAILEVRQKIDEKATDIQDHLKLRTAMIEKDIMEKRLSQQLGYQVKLQIVGDEVTGVQQLLQQRGVGQMPQGGGGLYNQPPQQPQQPYYQPPPQQYPPPQGGGGAGVPYQQQPNNNNPGAGVPYQRPPVAGGGAGVPYQPPQGGQYQPPAQPYQPPNQPRYPNQQQYTPPQNVPPVNPAPGGGGD